MELTAYQPTTETGYSRLVVELAEAQQTHTALKQFYWLKCKLLAFNLCDDVIFVWDYNVNVLPISCLPTLIYLMAWELLTFGIAI